MTAHLLLNKHSIIPKRKVMFRLCVVLGILIGVCSCGTSPPEIPLKSVERRGDDIGTQGYRAGIGDAIDIFVIEDSSFNGSYIVRPSGDIILPKVGRVQVSNMDLNQIEASLSKFLQANQLTTATVIADPVRRGAGGDENNVMAGITIYLSGSVAKGGRVVVPFVGNAQVSAYQAIVDSGGFGAFANKRKSYLLRKDRAGRTTRIPIDFSKMEKGESPDLFLQDGDTIVVPQKLFGF